ncbi:MAG: MaoC family dehydratase [Dermatophilaceae bacterium]|nr:MaoC family dehydratase [Dermatophilaceae bacterium]
MPITQDLIDTVATDAVSTGIISEIGLALAPTPLVILGLNGLREAQGTDLGVSPWITIGQDAIDAFARVTNDHQWIHVDPQRAASGPFGAAIAHGFLTISLSNSLLWEVAVVTEVQAALNMGVNKVRFPAPVRVGSRLRMHVSLSDVKDIKDNGVETIYHLVYECEGETKPPCVADMVMRYYG